jgi:hypothetical protein
MSMRAESLRYMSKGLLDNSSTSYVDMSRAEACDAMLRDIKARFDKLPDLANAIQADHVKAAQEIEATL